MVPILMRLARAGHTVKLLVRPRTDHRTHNKIHFKSLLRKKKSLLREKDRHAGLRKLVHH